jgi:flagellar motor switch protein FliN
MSNINEVPGGFDDPAISAVADPGASMGGGGGGGGGDTFDLPNLQRAIKGAISPAGGPIELLKDVNLNVKIELGRTRMLIEDVLRLAEGSVVELDKLAGDPVDVFVNEQLVARGEVLVLNDNFCVRVNEIITAQEE